MKKRKLMSIFLVLAILLILILLAFLFVWKKSVQIREQEEASSEEEATVSEEETTEELEEVVYPKPQYDFKTEEIIVEIPNLTEEYTIAWVSDLHIVTDDEISDDILEEDLEAVKARYELFQTEDGVPSEELLPEVIDFLNYGKFDGIIFGGDMLDYCSKSNMEKLSTEFARLNPKVPTLYVRADHDYGFWYGGEAFTESAAENLHKEMADGDDLEMKYLDFDEFIITGINRSTKDMRADQYGILDEIFTEAEAQKQLGNCSNPCAICITGR